MGNRKDSKWGGGVTPQVLELAHNMDLLASDIARQVGVSRERVRQILNSNGLVTNRHRVSTPICVTCGRSIRLVNRGAKKYCSRECQRKAHLITIRCEQCGSMFQRSLSSVKRDYDNGRRIFFCSKSCQGKYIGSHYGFQRGHSAIVNSGSKRKFNYYLIWKSVQDVGYPKTALLFKVSVNCLYRLIYRIRNTPRFMEEVTTAPSGDSLSALGLREIV